MVDRPSLKDDDILDLFRKTFPEWFRSHVNQLDPSPKQNLLKDLAYGPIFQVKSYGACFANGYRFHTQEYGGGLTTQNSGVMVNRSCYGENHIDYYGILKEIIELEYSGANKVILFLCDWYDPKEGVTHDFRHDIVDVIPTKYLRRFEPFVLTSQADQVCYVPQVSRKRKKDEVFTVMKIKARAYIAMAGEATINEFEELYQPDYEPPQPIVVDHALDQVSIIPPNSVLWQTEDEEGTFVEDECEDDEENEQEESVDYSDED